MVKHDKPFLSLDEHLQQTCSNSALRTVKNRRGALPVQLKELHWCLYQRLCKIPLSAKYGRRRIPPRLALRLNAIRAACDPTVLFDGATRILKGSALIEKFTLFIPAPR
jgi:hypothetical protein